MSNSTEDKKRQILDIEDYNKSFEVLDKDIKSFGKLLDKLNIEFINKISGKLIGPGNNNYYLIRDSINFRFSSILFHLRLLQVVQNNQYMHLNKANSKQLSLHENNFTFLDQQCQLFDSIIFHSISLFDYLGNLLGIIAVDKTNMKWNAIMDSVGDLNNPFSKFSMSQILKKTHQELIDKLYNYRSELIHNSKDSGGALGSYNLFKDQMKFTVMAPKKICKKFHKLRELNKDKDLTINYVIFWIVEKILKSTIEIVKSLIEHMSLYRKTPIGSDIFYLRNPQTE